MGRGERGMTKGEEGERGRTAWEKGGRAMRNGEGLRGEGGGA